MAKECYINFLNNNNNLYWTDLNPMHALLSWHAMCYSVAASCKETKTVPASSSASSCPPEQVSAKKKAKNSKPRAKLKQQDDDSVCIS